MKTLLISINYCNFNESERSHAMLSTPSVVEDSGDVKGANHHQGMLRS